jgi:hypothetical protein
MNDLYSRAGVIDMRVRLVKTVRTLAAEKGVPLNPGGPVSFEGSISLPVPGVPWKLMLHSALGKSALAVLSSQHLEEFKAGRWSPVARQIGEALNALAHS